MKNKTIQCEPQHTAVVTIDIQKDYFPGGRFPLWRARHALKQTRLLLSWARQRGLPIIHIQHFTLRPGARFLQDGTPGTALHPGLEIRAGELVIAKHFPNSFRETNLEQSLRDRGITTVIWAGMISWMCVDTTVRAAFDLGFINILIHDATASGPLLRNVGGLPGILWPWRLQSAFMAALGAFHARVIGLRDLLRLAD